MWQTSNPAIRNDEAFRQLESVFAGGRETEAATVQGVVNKTAVLALLAVGAGAASAALLASVPSLLWISNITAFVVCLGVYFVIARRPDLARIVAPIYAIVQGAFLGALTGALDKALIAMNAAAAGGVGLQAFIITASILVAMLGLYSAGIVRPTRLLASILSVATAGIMITYLASFALGFFGVSVPFVSLSSAAAGGNAALIGLGINVLILGIASFWLIIDFGMIQERVASGAPKAEEWYCAHALMVSLAWIYFEAVKLAFRVALLLNRRD
jgi:uncharacterized YccA/Bax inhibitor family protein